MDELPLSTLFIALGILLLISGYFSGSETGMMSVNRYRLRHLAQSGHRGARRVSFLLDRPDRLIGLILIGNNLVNIAASAIATIIGMRLYGDYGIAIATVVLTLMVLIFAEVTPKTIAALHPERIAFPSSWLLKPMLKIFYPLVAAVNFITNGLMRMMGINPQAAGKDTLSAEELRTVVHEAGQLIPSRHQEMLLSILDLEKVTVDDIMIPRNDINAIDINADWGVITRQLINMQNTLVVLFRGEIDDAIGFLHARDMVRLITKYQDEADKPSLVRAARDIYFIPEGTPLNVQLVKFQQNKERIGLVVDEYGDIQGLVTLEDILEEIVGDFTTTIAGQTTDNMTREEDGSMVVEGTANLRELNKELQLNFPIDGPKTLNGLLTEHIGDIPDSVMCVEIANHRIEIIEVTDSVIKEVRILPSTRKKSRKKAS
ncbi:MULTISPECIES: HlyC/CorC family transporter [Gammaproteobacteria]|uniref:HlyC/CorC family transporter n=1 Tax=Gammaproteobacteria TaxID=1236 RepID=UPI000DD0B8F0|nr:MULTISPECIES: HlyC/CorC family transporter [Gammaproteobacteria]RTE87553.1 HlyC/CorC family transporter [Aliidiomarina sp. B3213]TCZ92662.1 HlyC/CorC family transporter [Lysobacter sp. N42]